MGMYDRDWYREERRQARQSLQQQPIPAPVIRTAKKGPPGLSSGVSVLIVLAVFAAGLIALGFA